MDLLRGYMKYYLNDKLIDDFLRKNNISKTEFLINLRTPQQQLDKIGEERSQSIIKTLFLLSETLGVSINDLFLKMKKGFLDDNENIDKNYLILY